MKSETSHNLTPKKLSQRDIAGILQIDTKTLYNWRKNKPELYTIVLLGFKFKEVLRTQREICDKLERIEKELNERLRM